MGGANMMYRDDDVWRPFHGSGGFGHELGGFGHRFGGFGLGLAFGYIVNNDNGYNNYSDAYDCY
jgi:hypothetical protein